MLVPAAYTASVERAGGLPIAIPPVEGSTELLDLLDGLVFTGGSDLNPALYGQEPHPETTGVHDERDRAELALIREALRRDMPVLGICRGMQLLNVALGGDLHQHLGSETHKGPPGRYTFHDVTVEPGTRLADVLGAGTRTHSCHHQAPDRLGAGLRVARPGRGRHGRGGRAAGGAVRRSACCGIPRRTRCGGAPLFARAGRPGHHLPAGGGVSATAVEGLVIGGERVAAAEGASFDVTNPATGTRLASVAAAGAEDVDRAVAAATAAYEVWGALSPVTRGRHMHRFAALVEEHTDELALLECRNVGMPIGDARGQLGMIVDVHPLLRRRGRQVLRPHDPGRARRRGADVPRADRRRRPDHALELPAQHRQLEDRAGARRRQHRGAEAGVADAALGAALRRAGGRGGHPGRAR